MIYKAIAFYTSNVNVVSVSLGEFNSVRSCFDRSSPNNWAMWSSNSDAVIVGIAALIFSSYNTLSIPKEEKRRSCHVFLTFCSMARASRLLKRTTWLSRSTSCTMKSSILDTVLLYQTLTFLGQHQPVLDNTMKTWKVWIDKGCNTSIGFSWFTFHAFDIVAIVVICSTFAEYRSQAAVSGEHVSHVERDRVQENNSKR